MKLLNVNLFAFFGCFLLISCDATYYIEDIKPTNFSKPLTISDKVTVTASGKIEINDYQRTFDQHFNSQQDFINQFNFFFTEALKGEHFLAAATLDSNKAWSIAGSYSGLNGDYTQEELKDINNLFNKAEGNYIVNISHIEISGMKRMNDDFVIIRASFKVFEKATRKTIVEFNTEGIAKAEFVFGPAMEKAIERCAYKAVGFLEFGNNKFKRSQLKKIKHFEFKDWVWQGPFGNSE